MVIGLSIADSEPQRDMYCVVQWLDHRVTRCRCNIASGAYWWISREDAVSIEIHTYQIHTQNKRHERINNSAEISKRKVGMLFEFVCALLRVSVDDRSALLGLDDLI